MEDYVRDPIPQCEVEDKDLIFHAISWYGCDIEPESSGGDEDDSPGNKEYQMYVHGVTETGNSVCLRIMNFVFYYYVKIPDQYQDMWSSEQTNIFYNYLKFRLGKVKNGLVAKTLVNKVDVQGFRNLEKQKFIRLCFKTELVAKRCKYMLSKPVKIQKLSSLGIRFMLYESNLDTIVRFTHLRNIRTAGWIKVKKKEFSLEDDGISSAQIQATVHWRQVHPYMVTKDGVMVDCESIAPFRILSWDIETRSSRGFPEFPNADIKEDYICQIGCCLWIFGGEKIKFILSSVESAPIDDGILINCKSEKIMIKRFCDILCNVDPDILTGYNTWGFDDKYLWRRIEINDLLDYANKMSRITEVEPQLAEKNLVSGAYGNNEFKIIDCPGRETLDLIMAIRREYKLESYKLGRVGTHFGQGNKVSMMQAIGPEAMLTLGYTEQNLLDHEDPESEKEISEYDVMFRIIDSGVPELVKTVCVYCIQDANLVIDLMEKLCVIPNNVEMAKSTRVPIGWLLLKGQQCKVFSQIVYEARLRDFVVPVLDYDDKPTEKFKGATVLTAMRGAYLEQPVSGLDFKSLYPSIMIAYNMCHSTLVMDPKYMGIKGVEYDTIAWHEEAHKDDNTKEWIEAKDFSYTFVQDTKGLLPDILDRLWKDRNATKREMKGEYKKCFTEHGKKGHETCSPCKYRFRAQVLNGKQLAIKVTMNSVYGFTGAGKGMLPCRPVAGSVTAKGREMIAHTSKLAQEMYSCTTTYGDSVPGYQKVKVRIKGVVVDIPIEELYNTYSDKVPVVDYINGGRKKKQLFVGQQPMESWTSSGWNKTRRVIRHKTKKRMFKVTTDKGVVYVTEDHSLINVDGKCIKPGELNVGSRIMHKTPP